MYELKTHMPGGVALTQYGSSLGQGTLKTKADWFDWL